MRQILAQMEGKRLKFAGTAQSFGTRPDGGKVLGMIDIRDFRGEYVADHLWIHWNQPTYWFIQRGARLEFYATVTPYWKRVKDSEDKILDFTLSDLTGLKRLT